MWARLKVAVLASLVGMTLLTPNLVLNGDVGDAPSDKSDIFLLSFHSQDSDESIRDSQIEIIEDYGNGYFLARGNPNHTLSDVDGIDIRTIPDRTILRFPASGYAFDTKSELPFLPPELRSIDSDERILQFIGPIKAEWVQEVEALGIHLEEYVESFAYLAVMSDEQSSAAGSLPFVNWIGTYEPAYKIQSELLKMEGRVPISVIAHDGVEEVTLRGLLEGLGADVKTTWILPVTAEATLESSMIASLAARPEVLSIFWSPEAKQADWASGEILGFHEAWVPLRSGMPWNLTGRSPGPDGIQGTADDVFEIVGIQDTGLDANNPDAGWPDLFLGPLGDRVIAIRKRTAACNQPDGRTSGFGHGTVVVGTVLSNGYLWESQYGLPTDDFAWDESEAGVVPEGKLSFDCIVTPGGGLQFSPTYWDDEYTDGARTFSNSFGGGSKIYDVTATAADTRSDASNDKMFIFATLNEGPYLNTVSGMSKGKNGLSVGAAQTYRPDRYEADSPDMISTFSSRGNPGERFKPDIVTVGTVITGLAYGEWIYNAGPGGGGVPQEEYVKYVDQYNYLTGGLGGDGIPDYRYYSGTSVSTPNAAGLYMLVREYFREAHGIDNVNSQLAKAMLINGAVRMNPDLYEYPGVDQGWGRADLEQSLFPPAPRTNQWEEGTMVTTGTWSPATMNLDVVSSDVPMKVTLVWIDSSGPNLVRNLDLIVRDPTGSREYHGNQYGTSGQLDGWTDPNDSGFDSINNVEQVEIREPPAGTWQVEVRGISIPSPAKFALVFSADIGPSRDTHVSLSTEHTKTIEVAPGGAASMPFDAMNFGRFTDIISMSQDAPPQFSASFDWTIASLTSGEIRPNLVTFTASPSAMAGSYPVLVCAVSLSNLTAPPASDCIPVRIFVIASGLPPKFDVTQDASHELDPSVLTFTRGGMNHIFVAYRKITEVNQSDPTLGGGNIWVAHNTIGSDTTPNSTWSHQPASETNDLPVNIRMLYMDNGTYAGRVVITWSGMNPAEPVAEYQPWGRIAYSDPPYSSWIVRTIQNNYGSSVFNRVRTSFPAFRMAGGPGGTLIWIWEHLDSPSAPPYTISAVQVHAAFSFDGGDTWSDCWATPSECYFIAPGGVTGYYFFPSGVVDQNGVLWIFYQWRSPTETMRRKLAVTLWDGPTWDTGWTAPINIWDLGGTNKTEYPAAVSTAEGGNRVYVAAALDGGTGWTRRVFVTYAEGAFGSGIVGPPPAATATGNISSNFSMPQGPMGNSALSSRYNGGPILNMLSTDDGNLWVSYAEEEEELGGREDMATWRSSDAFAIRSVVNVTEDNYGKGRPMADSLTIGSKGCLYEVWHESRMVFAQASYDVQLAVYCSDWQSTSDNIGPVTQNQMTSPNELGTSSTSLRVSAQISDVYTGFSNITAAELVLTDTTVEDSSLVDWSSAWTMNLTGIDRSPTEAAWIWANDTIAGWATGSCNRFWIRGQDSRGNWGTGDHVDVCVVFAPKVPRPPTITQATLTGFGWGDVTLAWSRSADDGGGTGEVVAYKILKAENIAGPYSVVQSVLATGSPDYTWSDLGSGNNDPHDYFFRIVANTTYLDSSPTRLAAKFFRNLTAGKQLVSIPLEQADYNVFAVLKTIDLVYARTYVATTASPWRSYMPGRPFNSLTRMDILQGYWVELGTPGMMTVAGLVPMDVTMSLRSGWNLIGFPSFNESYTLADLDAAIGGTLQYAEIFDPMATSYNLQKVQRSAWSTTYLKSGQAYMVCVSSDVIWSVPNY